MRAPLPLSGASCLQVECQPAAHKGPGTLATTSLIHSIFILGPPSSELMLHKIPLGPPSHCRPSPETAAQALQAGAWRNFRRPAA